MGVLTEQQIKEFLAIDVGYGDGDSSGRGSGNGNGYGRGYDNNNGNGYGRGYGYGNDDGNGGGCGNGNGRGSDSLYSYGYGVQEIDGYNLYDIDGMPTAIISIRGNIAKGFILGLNVTRNTCYIVKEANKFAHGSTLHEAFAALQEKLYDDSTEEERIEIFKKKFPSYDTKYSNKDLFTYHHILTGSCRMGRESFCNNNGINLAGKTTVREFVALTKNVYGGSIIEKLPKAYKITD